MRQIIRWETRDGKEFPTEDEARAHYAEHPEAALVGLLAEDIEDALAGKAPDIAEALEKLGVKLQRKRCLGWTVSGEPEALPYVRGRGARDFHAGIGGIVPDDLRGTPAAELWLRDWDAASVEAKRSVPA